MWNSLLAINLAITRYKQTILLLLKNLLLIFEKQTSKIFIISLLLSIFLYYFIV